MGDNKRKDYDPTLLRAVGNIIAGDSGQRWRDSGLRAAAVNEAIEAVLMARNKLRKLQKAEEES